MCIFKITMNMVTTILKHDMFYLNSRKHLLKKENGCIESLPDKGSR